MVWFHGGGYALGSKISNGSPIGLLQTSFEGGGEGAIYVAMNYRLAAFGWLAGPTLQSNGTANAGFYDQRLALEWVQTHIHLFGGDPGRVTAFGESAGGGSILHQITAYGGAQGSNSTPFQQALMQSPAFIPSPGHYTHETIFQAFLKNANVSTLQAARQLPSSILLAANKATQATAFYGTFNFGPSPDGSFVPDLPGNLLLQGSYDHQLVVLAAHNSNEGNRYTDPKATNDTAFTEYMQLYFPQANPAVISYLSETLYPPIYNGSLPYTTPFGRLDLAISEFTFTCNTNFLARAFNNQTHNYLFSIPPGNHTEDVPYTYFDGPNAAVLNDTVATTLQSYITTFVSTGDPNRAGLPTFPIYGSQATVLNLNQTFIDEITDPVANPRCLWWQKALYF
ncbi:MAG: hypothetical protein M1819_003320 [Sarea resinae]|nr:MAG: hypothetical protein M1819_003320 [Sarea resinae]